MRRVSLYWTFAGFFLIALLLATILQGVVVVSIVHPLMLRSASSRAELQTLSLAHAIATDLSDLDEAGMRRAVTHLLMQEGGRPDSSILIFEHVDGWRVSNRGGGMRRMRGEGAPRDPMTNHHLLASTPVRTAGREIGTLSAYSVARRFGGWAHAMPGLLFLPVAMLIAGAAALIMFRMLVRRLRRLEEVTVRVSTGDLDARIERPGDDEIGRLGSSFNSMTSRLRDARERLDEHDRQRRRLFADITHELATPLTSIRGFAETLGNPQLELTPAERQRYAEHIGEAAVRMAGILDELLELSRLEAGASEFQQAPVDLVPFCRHTQQRFERVAEQRGLRLEGEGFDGELWVQADGRRLEQVVDNLLSNALRYVPPGGTLRLRLERGRGLARIAVEDDGPGFPPEALPHVFDRFFRADSSRSEAGTGLGLAIVREIARRHGGEAGAENLPGGGARVWVDLPCS